MEINPFILKVMIKFQISLDYTSKICEKMPNNLDRNQFDI
jgi:hypothetical protein